MTDGSDRPFIKGFQDFVLIGRGGSASVYSAEQVALNRRVAVKVVEATADQARRFSREMLALGALATIPHVVTLHAVEQTSDGRPALIMPLMEDSLGGMVARTGRPCSVEDTLRWAGQLAIAIDQAHGHNIFHRDIKPENVLISKFGEAYLADFGIATLEGMTTATVTTLSLSPPYAPPERFSGGRVDPKAGDIYSFAATLYSVLAGRPPFGTAADGGSFGLASRIMDDRPAAIAGVGAAVNKALRAGLAKDPEKRPADAHSLVAAMGSATKSSKRPEHGSEDRRQDRHQDQHRQVSAGVYLDEVEARVGGKYDVAVPDGAGGTEVMAVLVPPLVEHGKILRIGGGTGPDVAVNVHVAGSSPFKRVGNDLTMVVPVKASDLRKGAKIEVPTVDGSSVAIRVPADTPTGRTFRVVGAGRYRRDGVGDLLVTLVSLDGAAHKNKGRLADSRRLVATTLAILVVVGVPAALLGTTQDQESNIAATVNGHDLTIAEISELAGTKFIAGDAGDVKRNGLLSKVDGATRSDQERLALAYAVQVALYEDAVKAENGTIEADDKTSAEERLSAYENDRKRLIDISLYKLFGRLIAAESVLQRIYDDRFSTVTDQQVANYFEEHKAELGDVSCLDGFGVPEAQAAAGKAALDGGASVDAILADPALQAQSLSSEGDEVCALVGGIDDPGVRRLAEYGPLDQWSSTLLTDTAGGGTVLYIRPNRRTTANLNSPTVVHHITAYIRKEDAPAIQAKVNDALKEVIKQGDVEINPSYGRWTPNGTSPSGPVTPTTIGPTA